MGMGRWRVKAPSKVPALVVRLDVGFLDGLGPTREFAFQEGRAVHRRMSRHQQQVPSIYVVAGNTRLDDGGRLVAYSWTFSYAWFIGSTCPRYRTKTHSKNGAGALSRRESRSTERIAPAKLPVRKKSPSPRVRGESELNDARGRVGVRGNNNEAVRNTNKISPASSPYPLPLIRWRGDV